MNIEEIIKQGQILRDGVWAVQEEIKGDAPHLATAAGHFSQAIRALEGHLASGAVKTAKNPASSN